MKKKKLSIIIPIYNSQEYLEKCIDSVLAQTYTDFNLILVDDASIDESGAICDKYESRDSRVMVIHHECNKGLSRTREDGYRLADTEWVSFIDNDDFIAPEMYERLMKNCDKAEIVCIRGEDKSTEEINKANWCGLEAYEELFVGKEACSSIYSKKLDFGCVGPIWGKIIKRELIEKVLEKVDVYKKELNWVYFEDVLFMPMLFYYSERVLFDNKLMYMHRHIKNNLSSTLQPREYHYQSMKSNVYVLKFFKEHNLQEAYEAYLVDSFLSMQSVWYKVWKNERDSSRKNKYYLDVDQFWKDNIYYLRNIKSKDLGLLVKKISIIIFHKNKYLWGWTIGNLYFCLLRKILY